jgi:hypothetical protein
MSADDFLERLRSRLSGTIQDRVVVAEYAKSYAAGGRGGVMIRFYDLPPERYRQRRGGGAENENNVSLLMVYGFGGESSHLAARVRVEQLINGIYGGDHPSAGNRAPNLRKKTSSPEKIADYVASYLCEVAENFPPRLTHEEIYP